MSQVSTTMIYLRRKRTACHILLEFFSVLVRSIAVCIGVIGIFNVVKDRERLLENNDYTDWGIKIAASGCDVIVLANVVLIAGAVLDWYLLVAAYIFTIAFVIIYSCSKYMATGVFPWTPGISYTSSIPFMTRFQLSESVRPIVAETIALINFVLVFFVFLMTALVDFKRNSNSRRQGLPIALPRVVQNVAPRQQDLEEPPPAYADVDLLPPPPYSVVVAKKDSGQ